MLILSAELRTAGRMKAVLLFESDISFKLSLSFMAYPLSVNRGIDYGSVILTVINIPGNALTCGIRNYFFDKGDKEP